MSAILLPGWNLAGRLPSLSGMRASGGRIALGGAIPYEAGSLLRTPKVIHLSNLMLVEGGYAQTVQVQAVGGSKIIVVQVPAWQSGFGERSRITDIMASLSARVLAAMPDAILARSPYASGSVAPSEPIGDDTTPVLGCDYLQIAIGILYSVGSGHPDDMAKYPGYSVYAYPLTGAIPGDSPGVQDAITAWGSVSDAIDTVSNNSGSALVDVNVFSSTMSATDAKAKVKATIQSIQSQSTFAEFQSTNDAAEAALADLTGAGMDVSVVSDSSEADEDALAQLISDHYGVTI